MDDEFAKSPLGRMLPNCGVSGKDYKIRQSCRESFNASWLKRWLPEVVAVSETCSNGLIICC